MAQFGDNQFFPRYPASDQETNIDFLGIDTPEIDPRGPLRGPETILQSNQTSDEKRVELFENHLRAGGTAQQAKRILDVLEFAGELEPTNLEFPEPELNLEFDPASQQIPDYFPQFSAEAPPAPEQRLEPPPVPPSRPDLFPAPNTGPFAPTPAVIQPEPAPQLKGANQLQAMEAERIRLEELRNQQSTLPPAVRQEDEAFVKQENMRALQGAKEELQNLGIGLKNAPTATASAFGDLLVGASSRALYGSDTLSQLGIDTNLVSDALLLDIRELGESWKPQTFTNELAAIAKKIATQQEVTSEERQKYDEFTGDQLTPFQGKNFILGEFFQTLPSSTPALVQGLTVGAIASFAGPLAAKSGVVTGSLDAATSQNVGSGVAELKLLFNENVPLDPRRKAIRDKLRLRYPDDEALQTAMMRAESTLVREVSDNRMYLYRVVDTDKAPDSAFKIDGKDGKSLVFNLASLADAASIYTIRNAASLSEFMAKNVAYDAFTEGITGFFDYKAVRDGMQVALKEVLGDDITNEEAHLWDDLEAIKSAAMEAAAGGTISGLVTTGQYMLEGPDGMQQQFETVRQRRLGQKIANSAEAVAAKEQSLRAWYDKYKAPNKSDEGAFGEGQPNLLDTLFGDADRQEELQGAEGMLSGQAEGTTPEPNLFDPNFDIESGVTQTEEGGILAGEQVETRQDTVPSGSLEAEPISAGQQKTFDELTNRNAQEIVATPQVLQFAIKLLAKSNKSLRDRVQAGKVKVVGTVEEAQKLFPKAQINSQAEGYFDKDTQTITFIAENIASGSLEPRPDFVSGLNITGFLSQGQEFKLSPVERMAIRAVEVIEHEYVGHQGLRDIMSDEDRDALLQRMYITFGEEIDVFRQERYPNANDLTATEEWIVNKYAEKGQLKAQWQAGLRQKLAESRGDIAKASEIELRSLFAEIVKQQREGVTTRKSPRATKQPPPQTTSPPEAPAQEGDQIGTEPATLATSATLGDQIGTDVPQQTPLQEEASRLFGRTEPEVTPESTEDLTIPPLTSQETILPERPQSAPRGGSLALDDVDIEETADDSAILTEQAEPAAPTYQSGETIGLDDVAEKSGMAGVILETNEDGSVDMLMTETGRVERNVPTDNLKLLVANDDRLDPPEAPDLTALPDAIEEQVAPEPAPVPVAEEANIEVQPPEPAELITLPEATLRTFSKYLELKREGKEDSDGARLFRSVIEKRLPEGRTFEELVEQEEALGMPDAVAPEVAETDTSPVPAPAQAEPPAVEPVEAEAPTARATKEMLLVDQEKAIKPWFASLPDATRELVGAAVKTPAGKVSTAGKRIAKAQTFEDLSARDQNRLLKEVFENDDFPFTVELPERAASTLPEAEQQAVPESSVDIENLERTLPPEIQPVAEEPTTTLEPLDAEATDAEIRAYQEQFDQQLEALQEEQAASGVSPDSPAVVMPPAPEVPSEMEGTNGRETDDTLAGLDQDEVSNIFMLDRTPTLIDRRNQPELEEDAVETNVTISGGNQEDTLSSPTRRERKFQEIEYNETKPVVENPEQKVVDRYGNQLGDIRLHERSYTWNGAHFNGGVGLDLDFALDADNTEIAHVILHELGHATHSLVGDRINQLPDIDEELQQIEDFLYPGLRSKVDAAMQQEEKPDVKFFNYLLSPEELIAEFNTHLGDAPVVDPQGRPAAPQIAEILVSEQNNPELVRLRNIMPTGLFGKTEAVGRLSLQDGQFDVVLEPMDAAHQNSIRYEAARAKRIIKASESDYTALLNFDLAEFTTTKAIGNLAFDAYLTGYYESKIRVNGQRVERDSEEQRQAQIQLLRRAVELFNIEEELQQTRFTAGSYRTKSEKKLAKLQAEETATVSESEPASVAEPPPITPTPVQVDGGVEANIPRDIAAVSENAPAQVALVNVDDIFISNELDGSINPDFARAAGVQPRDRTSLQADPKLREIIGEPDETRFLGNSPDPGMGAPIINNQGAVLSGNNRSRALKYLAEQATNQENQRESQFWQNYEDELLERAEGLGFSPSTVLERINEAKANGTRLIMVRRFTEDLPQGTIEKIANIENKPQVEVLSLAEKARDLGNQMNSIDVQSLITEDGLAITRKGVRERIQALVPNATEYKLYFTEDGGLTKEGEKIFTLALFTKAYPKELVDQISLATEIPAQVGALRDSVPKRLNLLQAVDAMQLNQDLKQELQGLTDRIYQDWREAEAVYNDLEKTPAAAEDFSNIGELMPFKDKAQRILVRSMRGNTRKASITSMRKKFDKFYEHLKLYATDLVDESPLGYEKLVENFFSVDESVLEDPSQGTLFSLRPTAPYQGDLFSDTERASIVTWFSGGGTLEASLGDSVVAADAVEYSSEILDHYNSVFNKRFLPRDINTVDPQAVRALDPKIFHASPVCKNFSKCKALKTAGALDLQSAEQIAKVIRQSQPPVVTIENVPDYAKTELYTKIIEPALKESGYTYELGIHDAADFGAIQHRKRMLVRAVREGDLPKVPPKTQGMDWYTALEDLIPSAPDMPFTARTRAKNWEQERIEKMISRGTLNGNQPIITMGGSAGASVANAANAGGPSPTLIASDQQTPRIILPGGAVKRVTPEMMRRLMGLPETYRLPDDPKLAKTILGNGIEGNTARALIKPLIDRNATKKRLEGPRTEEQFQLFSLRPTFDPSKIIDQPLVAGIKVTDPKTGERRNVDRPMFESKLVEVLQDLPPEPVRADFESESKFLKARGKHRQQYIYDGMPAGKAYDRLIDMARSKKVAMSRRPTQEVQTLFGDKETFVDGNPNRPIVVEEVVKNAAIPEILVHTSAESEYVQYQAPGGSNYRQIVLVHKNMEQNQPKYDYTIQGDHFPVENSLFFFLVQDRRTPDGEKVLFMDQLQSDRFQQGREFGFEPLGLEESRQLLEDQIQTETSIELRHEKVFNDLSQVYQEYLDNRVVPRPSDQDIQNARENAKEELDRKLDRAKDPTLPNISQFRNSADLILDELVSYEFSSPYFESAVMTRAAPYDAASAPNFIEGEREFILEQGRERIDADEFFQLNEDLKPLTDEQVLRYQRMNPWDVEKMQNVFRLRTIRTFFDNFVDSEDFVQHMMGDSGPKTLDQIKAAYGNGAIVSQVTGSRLSRAILNEMARQDDAAPYDARAANLFAAADPEIRALLDKVDEIKNKRNNLGVPPNFMQENWWRRGLEFITKLAAREGYDGIVLSNGDQTMRYNRSSPEAEEGTRLFYDQRYPNHLGKIAKNYDAVASDVNVDINKVTYPETNIQSPEAVIEPEVNRGILFTNDDYRVIDRNRDELFSLRPRGRRPLNEEEKQSLGRRFTNINFFENLFDPAKLIYRIKRIASGVSGFVDPFAYVKHRDELLTLRNLAKGKIQKAERVQREIYDGIRLAETPSQIYDMLTQGLPEESVTNESDRAIAVKARDEIDDLGKQLVDLGQIPQESYEKYRFRYLPQVYLKYLLPDEVNAVLSTGRKPSPLSYTKRRKLTGDNPTDLLVQEILGIVKDPAFLAAQSVGTVGRDIALLEYFQSLAENPAWTLQDQFTGFSLHDEMQQIINEMLDANQMTQEEAIQLSQRLRLHELEPQIIPSNLLSVLDVFDDWITGTSAKLSQAVEDQKAIAAGQQSMTEPDTGQPAQVEAALAEQKLWSYIRSQFTRLKTELERTDPDRPFRNQRRLRRRAKALEPILVLAVDNQQPIQANSKQRAAADWLSNNLERAGLVEMLKVLDPIIGMRGYDVTASYLSEEAQRIRDQIAPTKSAKYQQALYTLTKRMDDYKREALDKMGLPVDESATAFEGWAKMPKDKRYGALRGMWVKQEIYDDIVGFTQIEPGKDNFMEKFLFGDDSVAAKYQRYQKLFSVALNPPSMARNFVSNKLWMYVITGMPPFPINTRKLGVNALSYNIRAVQSLLSNDPNQPDRQYKEIFEKYGLGVGTFSNQELKRIRQEVAEFQIKLKTQKNKLSPAEKRELSEMTGLPIEEFKDFSAAEIYYLHLANLWNKYIVDKGGFIYQNMEFMDKMSVVMYAMEEKGLSEEEAVRLAEDALFDYSLVRPWVRSTRTSLLGAPFMTYTAKVLETYPRALKRDPAGVGRRSLFLLAWQYKLFNTLSKIIQFGFKQTIEEMFEEDEEDSVDALKKARGEWAEKNPSLALFPLKDSMDRFQLIDQTYYIPWGMFTRAAEEFSRGNIAKGVGEAGIMQGFVINLVAGYRTGVDPFTKQKFIDDYLPEEDQDVQRQIWLAQQLQPTILRGLIDEAYKYVSSDSDVPIPSTGGVIRQLIDALAAEGIIPTIYDESTLVDSEGQPKRTLGQSLGRTFAGANLYSVDPLEAQRRNIELQSYKLGQLKSRQVREAQKIAGNQNLSDKEKNERIRKKNEYFTKAIMQQYEKLLEIRKPLPETITD